MRHDPSSDSFDSKYSSGGVRDGLDIDAWKPGCIVAELDPEKLVQEARCGPRGAARSRSRANILASPSPELVVRRGLAALAGCKPEMIVDSIVGAYLAELCEEELHAEKSLSEDSLADELVTEASAELEARFDLWLRAELREARNEHVTPQQPRATV